jgi:hypothetical protein
MFEAYIWSITISSNHRNVSAHNLWAKDGSPWCSSDFSRLNSEHYRKQFAKSTDSCAQTFGWRLQTWNQSAPWDRSKFLNDRFSTWRPTSCLMFNVKWSTKKDPESGSVQICRVRRTKETPSIAKYERWDRRWLTKQQGELNCHILNWEPMFLITSSSKDSSLVRKITWGE